MSAALERFQALLPETEFTQLLQELERPLEPAIRANVLKCDPEQDIPRWAQEYGWTLRPVPFCPTGWWVTESREAISLPVEHRLGFYYIQDAASMLPVSLFDFDPQNPPLILDMAASPGGKTTHLIDRTLDRGLVIANDSSRDRITMLRLVLQNWGAMNTLVTRFPGEQFGAWYPDTFDAVLLDAPCSMQNLRSSEARPMHAISARERQMLSGRQERLLLSALRAVKPGGQVVYSTCTLDPLEDEAVLDSVLRAAGGSVQMLDVRNRLPVPAPGLERAILDGVEFTYSPQVRNALRLWPHLLGTSGFFSALLTRQGPISGKNEDPPRVTAGRQELKPLKAREERALLDQLAQTYEFDFTAVMETQDLSLWRHKKVLYAIPNAWGRFERLPFQSVGMRIAEEDPLQPSHEWTARFGKDFQAGVWIIEPPQAEAWLRGEDLPISDSPAQRKGQIVVVRDTSGKLYGRGKLLASRLRNLLPSRWVKY